MPARQADTGDPENFLGIFYHSSNLGATNTSFYNNPEVDKLLNQANEETDVAKRTALFNQAENIVVDEAPTLFISHAKQAKPPLNYATVGAGALQHLSMEFAKQRFGFDAIHVPYRQTGQSVTDLAAGHVDVGFVEAGASIPLIKS